MDQHENSEFAKLTASLTWHFQRWADRLGATLWLFGAGYFLIGFGLAGLLGAHNIFGSLIMLLLGVLALALYMQADSNSETASSSDQGHHDEWLAHALTYVSTNEWQAGHETEITNEDVTEASEKIIQCAFEGRLDIWGRANHGRRLEKMPANCWRDLGLNLETLKGDDAEELATHIITPGVKMMTNPFTHLRVNKRAMEAINWDQVVIISEAEEASDHSDN